MNNFATYKISLKLKEIGFDEECFGYYNTLEEFSEFSYYDTDRTNSTLQSNYGGPDKNCTAPLWQQVIRFLNEEGYRTPTGAYIYSDFRSTSQLKYDIQNILNIYD